MKFDIAYPFRRKDIAEAGTSFRPNSYVKSMNNCLSNFLDIELRKYGLSTAFDKKLSKSNGMTPSNDMKN